MTWGLTGCDALPENGNEHIKSFAEIRFTIKIRNGVYRVEEKPNYRMTMHRAGIRVVWPAAPPPTGAAAGTRREPPRTG